MRFALPLLTLLLILPHPAHAQLSALGIHLMTLSIESGTLAPHETVTIKVKSLSDDVSSNFMRWSVNGTTIDAGIGHSSARVVLGDIGKVTTVTATMLDTKGAVLDSESISITPAVVDLMWDTDTYAHPFFLGRTMPSPGARIRAEAYPVLIQRGTELEPAAINFEWRMNGSLLTEQSGVGRNSIVIPAPSLFGNGYLSVVASSEDGSVRAEKLVRIPSQDPHLSLYRIDPLMGIDFRNAIGSTSVVGDSEETFTLVPYSAAVPSLQDASLIVDWMVNKTPVQTHSNDMFTISLISPAPDTPATIQATISHATNYLVSAHGIWQTLFSQESSLNTKTINPFNEIQ